MTTIPPELQTYLSKMRDAYSVTNYIPRRFTAVSETGEVALEEYRFRGALNEREPGFKELLRHPRLLVLAEPGGGKSTVAKIAVQETIELRRIPVLIELKEYRGELRALLRRQIPESLLGAQAERTYVMDGMDELPAKLATNFAAELDALSTNDGPANFIVTSRQAFYVARRDLLDRLGFSAVFHLLDLTDQDIRAYVSNLGLNVDGFLAALEEVDAYDDVRNPFILSVLAARFRDVKTLGYLRSENVKFVIDHLIDSRPRINAHKQRRALRLLAVAIETYSRNELNEDEAARVIKASMRISTAEASDLLFALYGSILKRTAGGLAFQMRSYGEYLAAEELETVGLGRIRELAFMDFNTPNESWSNTITYLAELNPEVKDYFMRSRPFWMINASPAAFSEAERSVIASNVLQTLRKERQYLHHEPRVR